MNLLLYNHISNWKLHYQHLINLLYESANYDKVYLLNCDSSLISCPSNPYHKLLDCGKCQLNSTNISSNLNLKNLRFINLELHKEIVHLPFHIFPKNFAELENFRLYTVPFGELVLSQMVDERKDIFFSQNDFAQASRLLKNSLKLYIRSKFLIDSLKINMVYAWNGRRSSDGPILYAAKNLGVDFRSFIAASDSSKIILLNSTKIHDVDARKSHIKSNLSKFSYDNNASIVGGEFLLKMRKKKSSDIFPGFVNYNRFNASTYIRKNQKEILTFFTSSPFELAYMKEWKIGKPEFDDIFLFISKLNKSAALLNQFQIVIRWHPNLKNAGNRLRSKINSTIESTPNVEHISPGSEINSYSLLDQTGIVIVSFSTLAVEAGVNSIPVILIGRAKYEDLDFVTRPKNFQDLEDTIERRKFKIAPKSALKYAYYLATYGDLTFHSGYISNNLFSNFYLDRKIINLNFLQLISLTFFTLKSLVIKNKLKYSHNP